MRYEIIQPLPKTISDNDVLKLGLEFDTDDGVYVYSINRKGERKCEVWFSNEGAIEIMVPTGEERDQRLVSSNFKELKLI